MKRTRLKRKTRLRPVNPERRAKTRARQFGQQAALCRQFPCLTCGAPPPSDPAHVRSRGAGGGDKANVVPLCRLCHQRQHELGIVTFQRIYEVDLEARARELAREVYP